MYTLLADAGWSVGHTCGQAVWGPVSAGLHSQPGNPPQCSPCLVGSEAAQSAERKTLQETKHTIQAVLQISQ